MLKKINKDVLVLIIAILLMTNAMTIWIIKDKTKHTRNTIIHCQMKNDLAVLNAAHDDKDEISCYTPATRTINIKNKIRLL